MRIEFTVTGPSGRRDVAVVGDPAAPLSAVLGDLAALVGSADHPPWCDGAALSGAQTFGGGALRTGSVVSFGSGPGPVAATGVRTLALVGGAQAGQVIPLGTGRLSIGRAPTCDVVLDDDRVSRRHASLEIGRSALLVQDLGSTNGTTVDGSPVPQAGATLRPGELVRVGDTLLGVDGGDGTVSASVSRRGPEVVVNRAPRTPSDPDAGSILAPIAPSATRRGRVQWAGALVPAIAGAALAWLLHAPQFLFFALLSPLVLVSGTVSDRVHGRRTARRATGDFVRDRAAVDERIRVGLGHETARRRFADPDPVAVLRIAVLPGSRLWERAGADPDRLVVRVGSADRPSTLTTGSGSVVGPAGTLPAVPVRVDLRGGVVGLAGPVDAVDAVARWIVAQVAALHPPGDVELEFLLTARSSPGWEWARWLPHTRSASAAAGDRAEVVRRLTATVAVRRDRSGPGRNDRRGWSGPWTVVVVDDTSSVRDLPALPDLLASGPVVGVTALCLATVPRGLPTACTTVVVAEHPGGGRLTVRGPAGSGPAVADVIADRVSLDWAERLARALAPCVDGGTGHSTTLPADCTLGDLLDLDPVAVEHRWRASAGGARTVVGVGAGAVTTLDLVAQGPHVLIAGTTGSGKSELLRTLVVGLAANHPPDELTLLLVDYKGGAAFGACAALPHTAGLVTDLDPQLTRRALRSLHAELRRREQLFADAGAADLASYRRHRAGAAATSPGSACPRLVIVVDEFAALAEELPDFVTGLVGVARRGRSLGVHLVLATQRPGGAVSAEIRANTSLRIALRVTDVSDSADVVDAPDAAWLAAAQPGRGLIRAGSELAVFQVARVGMPASPRQPVVETLGPWRRRMLDPADVDDRLTRVVTDLAGCAARLDLAPALSPWLDPLPADLRCSDLPPVDAAGALLALGRLDDPDRQDQPLLAPDLDATESWLLVGRSGAGRSTALVTVALAAARRFEPDDLEVYVVDGRGSLAALLRSLPHVATAVGPEDPDLTGTLLRRLSDPPRAGRERPGPRRLLLIDGWDEALERLEADSAGRCTELLAGLLRSATATIMVTGGRSLLLPRFAGAFRHKLLLALSDRNDYALAGVRLADVPADLPPGRGVRVADGLTFQLAHPGDPADEGSVARRAAGISAGPRGTAAPTVTTGTTVDTAVGMAVGEGVGKADDTAVRLRALPSSVRLDVAAAGAPAFVLGLAGDAAEPCQVDLLAHRARLLVIGPARSGKSTALRVLLAEAIRQDIAVRVAATARSPLAAAARAAGLSVLTPDATAAGPRPHHPTLVLIDDGEAFTDGPAADLLTAWLHDADAPLAVALSGRSDDLVATYRGPVPLVRRARCGVLLRPGPLDGELLGVRLGRRVADGPAGRGVIVGDPAWGPMFAEGDPVPIQVAQP